MEEGFTALLKFRFGLTLSNVLPQGGAEPVGFGEHRRQNLPQDFQTWALLYGTSPMIPHPILLQEA